MPIYTDGITKDYVNNNAQAKLAALRAALHEVQNFYAWLSAYAPADLTAMGFSPGGAQAIFDAFTDANALATLYDGGGLGSYTLPYKFSASQRAVIGPLT